HHALINKNINERKKRTNIILGSISHTNLTLNRFFSFHFILLFIILLFIFLHLTGSSNLTEINRDLYKILFHPYIFRDPDNFTLANCLDTHIHIQPE
ncbi:Cytochrome b, partial [Atta colombica]